MSARRFSGFAQAAITLAILSLPTTFAVDLCQQGYKAYSKQYSFLIDSYASIAPDFFLSDNSVDENAQIPATNLKVMNNARSPRACARQCCLWNECAMLVFETQQRLCTLINCDKDLQQSGACRAQLDVTNTNMFSVQDIVTATTSEPSDVPNSSVSSGESDGDNNLNAINTEPKRYVTVYLRLRSSLMKAYLDDMRSLASDYSLDSLVNTTANASRSAILELIDLADNSSVAVGPSRAYQSGVFVQPCEVDDDCDELETCSYGASSKDKNKNKNNNDYDYNYEDEDVDEDDEASFYRSKRQTSTVSSSEMRSMMSSFESAYENVDLDDDAGVCACRDGYMRVNATATSAGSCVVNPNAGNFNGNSNNQQGIDDYEQNQPQNITIEVVEEDVPLFFGLLASNMEGLSLVYIMVMVVVGLLGLLLFTWLCVVCKVRIGNCLRACCDRLSTSRDETLRNTRANTSASTGAKRNEYRALMSNEEEADTVVDEDDDDEDEDVSFDRRSLKPVNNSRSASINMEASRGRRYDSEKLK